MVSPGKPTDNYWIFYLSCGEAAHGAVGGNTSKPQSGSSFHSQTRSFIGVLWFLGNKLSIFPPSFFFCFASQQQRLSSYLLIWRTKPQLHVAECSLLNSSWDDLGLGWWELCITLEERT